MMVQDVSGRISHDPQPDDQAADGNDPFAGRVIFSAEPGSFAKAERLSAEANDHEQSAEDKCEPCHDLDLYRIRSTTGKGQNVPYSKAGNWEGHPAESERERPAGKDTTGTFA